LVLLAGSGAALAQPVTAPVEPEAEGKPAEPGLEGEGDGQGEGEDEDEDDALGAPEAGKEGAIERTTLGAPSARWTTWSVEGRLKDPLEVVTGFLEPIMQERKNWTDSDQREVAEFLQKIGYYVLVQNQPSAEGGVHAVLSLEPVTVVRWISIDIDSSAVQRIHNPIFADDLRRRMTLRPGAPLALDQTRRAQQLESEANRLAQYLRNEGFYDVVVTMNPLRMSAHELKLRIKVSLGTPYTVGRITVSGNTAISAQEIHEVFLLRKCVIWLWCKDARFSRTALAKHVDQVVAMYQKRGFPGVRVSTDFDIRHSFKRDIKRVEFHVEVRERRKIDVVFEGSRYPEDRLRSHLTLNEEGSYDDVELERSAEALRRFCQSQGYFEASVTWERVRFGVFERIVYSIQEGDRLEVSEIAFQGNRAVTRERLRSLIVTRPFRRVIIGAGGGFATSLQLEQDADRIVKHYQARGYRDVRVDLRVARSRALLGNAAALAAAVAVRLPARGLHVHFVIDEGPQHKVEDVRFEFEGPAQLDPSRLAPALKQQPGIPFINEQVATDSEALRQVYYAHGFPRAQIDSRFEPGRSPSSIVVTHTITPNSQARVGKIALRGNFITADWVVRSEMGLREGQLLTVGALEQAQSNLRASGLFSSVQLEYIGLDDPRQPVVNVIANVEERHDNLIEAEAGGGYSTDKQAFVEGAVIKANLLGTGTRFELRGVLGMREQSLEARLTFPRWLMRRGFRAPFLLETSGFIKRDHRERFGVLQTLGISVAATRDFKRGKLEGLLLQLRYDFRLRTRDLDLVRPAGNNDDIDKTPVKTRTSTIGPLVAFDRRKDRQGRRNPLLPEKGFRIEGRAGYGEDFLLGSARFVKLGGAAQHFIPLATRFVLSNAIRYDHGIPLGGDVVLPEVERFFGGGDTTVRGFEQDRLAIEVIEEMLPPFGGVTQFRVVPAGGNIRFIHNLDLEMRVWEDSPVFGFPIASAIFLDTGLVTNSLHNFQPRDLRHSAGIALARIIAPFGKFSLEYAVPLDPQLGDDPQGRAHVNFGFLF
jgi:outer membrane protein insertion porin family